MCDRVVAPTDALGVEDHVPADVGDEQRGPGGRGQGDAQGRRELDGAGLGVDPPVGDLLVLILPLPIGRGVAGDDQAVADLPALRRLHREEAQRSRVERRGVVEGDLGRPLGQRGRPRDVGRGRGVEAGDPGAVDAHRAVRDQPAAELVRIPVGVDVRLRQVDAVGEGDLGRHAGRDRAGGGPLDPRPLGLDDDRVDEQLGARGGREGQGAVDPDRVQGEPAARGVEALDAVDGHGGPRGDRHVVAQLGHAVAPGAGAAPGAGGDAPVGHRGVRHESADHLAADEDRPEDVEVLGLLGRVQGPSRAVAVEQLATFEGLRRPVPSSVGPPWSPSTFGGRCPGPGAVGRRPAEAVVPRLHRCCLKLLVSARIGRRGARRDFIPGRTVAYRPAGEFQRFSSREGS